MTMAWTAQTGLGPRTVALSLKVFIVVMFYTHERFGISTAQPGIELPVALQKNRDELIKHFCTAGQRCGEESKRLNCGHAQLSSNRLCLQICNSQACNAQCWNTAEASLCEGNQRRICGYSNADVCQNKNGNRTRICVYTSYSSPAFCICQQNSRTPYTICDPPATAAQATTERATTAQATTAQAITAQATTAQAITAQATAARSYTTDQPINVVGIVFGSLFALMLLLVIIGAVILCLHTQGRLPSLKQASNPASFSSVELEARSSTRALPPEPSVPDSSMEYSYTYDHIPAMLGAKADPNQDGLTYCSLNENGHREGNPRYVFDGQRKKPTAKELETATGNTKDHPYFVLNINEGADEVGSESGGEHADGDEVTDSSIGIQATEVIDKEYTPLVPTGDPRSRTEQYGNEVAVSPTSFKKPSPIDSPTEGLSNGDAGTYFPLILSAEPKSQHMEQSGYEDTKIPTSESHDATSPTEAQSISCDDNTYTLLIRTAKPKSQKEHSGYEVPIIPNLGLAADGDVTSPYDHLDRKEENELKEGALSTADHDDYQQLVNNK